MEKTSFYPKVVITVTLLFAAIIAAIWLWPEGEGQNTLSQQAAPDSLPVEVQVEEVAPKPLPSISPEMAGAIRQLSNHSTEGLQETVNPDGSITLDHQGHFQSVMVAVKGPDGKIYTGHGEDFLQNIQPR